MRTLSIISLLGMETLWFSEIMVNRIGFSLFTRTLDTILYDTLHRLIGQISLVLVGFFVLGMKAIFF